MNSKLFKTKILSLVTAVALLAGVGLVYGSTSREDPKVENKKVVSQEWFYKLTSTDPADVNNSANYQSTPLPGVSCNGDDIVCRIVDVPSSGDSSIPALSLGTVTGNLTAYSTQFKPEP